MARAIWLNRFKKWTIISGSSNIESLSSESKLYGSRVSGKVKYFHLVSYYIVVDSILSNIATLWIEIVADSMLSSNVAFFNENNIAGLKLAVNIVASGIKITSYYIVSDLLLSNIVTLWIEIVSHYIVADSMLSSNVAFWIEIVSRCIFRSDVIVNCRVRNLNNIAGSNLLANIVAFWIEIIYRITSKQIQCYHQNRIIAIRFDEYALVSCWKLGVYTPVVFITFF